MNDILDALRAAGATIRGRKVKCPFHEDGHASGGIYQGPDGRWRFKCFVCVWNQGKSFGHANDVRRAIGMDAQHPLRVPRGAPPSPADRPPDFEGIWATYTDAGLVDLAARLGLALDAVRDMGYRTASRGVYGLRVWSSAESLTGIQLRSLDGRKWCITGTHTGLFVPDKQPAGETLIITEGATDAAYAAGVGFPALARFSAGLDPQHVVRWIAGRKRRYRTIAIIADRDPAGIESAGKLARAVSRLRGSVVKMLYAAGKDLRGWAPEGDALRMMIRSASPV